MPRRGGCRFDMVLLANRDAAAGDDQVVVDSSAALADRQADPGSECVGKAHGITVHCRVVERRNGNS